MARTTKSTSRKSGGRFKRFLRALAPTNGKKQFIWFIVIFALIGGGIFLYRSFAATGVAAPRNGKIVIMGNNANPQRLKLSLLDLNTKKIEPLSWDNEAITIDSSRRALTSGDGSKVYYAEINYSGYNFTTGNRLVVRDLMTGNNKKVLAQYPAIPGEVGTIIGYSDKDNRVIFSVKEPGGVAVKGVYSIDGNGKGLKKIIEPQELESFGSGSNVAYRQYDNKVIYLPKDDRGGYGDVYSMNTNGTNKKKDVNGPRSNALTRELSPAAPLIWRTNDTISNYTTDTVVSKTPPILSGQTLTWSPDGNYFIGQLRTDAQYHYKIFDTKTGKLVHDLGPGVVIVAWQSVYESFNPNGATTRQAMAAFIYRISGSPDVPTAAAKCGPGKPGPFKDVKGDHPFCKEIEWMRASGTSTGYDDGTYKPNDKVARQAVAAFIYRLAGSPAVPTAAQKCGNGKPGPFKDVKGNHPFCKEIEWMRASGMSTGYDDGSYKPGDPVARQAMAAFLHRLKKQPEPSQVTLPLYTDVPNNHPFYKAIQWLAEQR